MADGSAPLLPAGSCCGAAPAAMIAPGERWARPSGDGLRHVDFSVPEMHCAACIASIERSLRAVPGVRGARANLSLRRVGIDFDEDGPSVAQLARVIADNGFTARPFDAAALDAHRKDATARELLACLAVAGFAAANVMLLSVSVWSGAEAATRDLMHWISALIALPTIAFAGRPFFRSALRALGAWRLNMDVPISLAVLLAGAVSLFETIGGGAHAYFDASVSLLFFLLIGRYLDHRTRGLARSAAAELTALSARSAAVVGIDGTIVHLSIEEVAPGMTVAVAPGERIPADGEIVTGRSDLDRSMLTGESTPEPAGPGDTAHAGVMNLTGPLTLRVTASGEETLLADIARMIADAESGATRYVRWADRAARIYAPGVHLVALLTLVGWLVVSGGDWHRAILAAAAVLIITCPCALGLAVPAVHATASGVLFRHGILLKDGAALEKLAEIDTVVFDKTGTLTNARPALIDGPEDPSLWSAALALAAGSRHPLSRALLEGGGGRPAASARDLREVPGCGVEGLVEGRPARLGRADWCGAAETENAGTSLWLRVGDDAPARFGFEDSLKDDAIGAVDALRREGLDIRLLSGDAPGAVARAAAVLGIEGAQARMTPADKFAALERMADDGRKVLMVGDGINDAPALAAASVSMSPADGMDISRAAAAMVFSGEQVQPVRFAWRVARKARLLAMQNFALAALYNAVAIPLAVLGFATPLVAALAMSGSSIVVTLNAMRLRRMRTP